MGLARLLLPHDGRRRKGLHRLPAVPQHHAAPGGRPCAALPAHLRLLTRPYPLCLLPCADMPCVCASSALAPPAVRSRTCGTASGCSTSGAACTIKQRNIYRTRSRWTVRDAPTPPTPFSPDHEFGSHVPVGRPCLCLVFPLPSQLRHCLCLVFPRWLKGADSISACSWWKGTSTAARTARSGWNPAPGWPIRGVLTPPGLRSQAGDGLQEELHGASCCRMPRSLCALPCSHRRSLSLRFCPCTNPAIPARGASSPCTHLHRPDDALRPQYKEALACFHRLSEQSDGVVRSPHLHPPPAQSVL